MEHLNNVDAIYKEYPFLEKHIMRKDVLSATVRRLDTDSVRDTYPRRPHTAKDWGADSYYILCLIDADGNIISSVGSLLRNEKEELGQALSRIGTRANEVHFGLEMKCILKHHQRRFLKDKSECVITDKLILHKLPRGIENGEAWVDAIAEEGLSTIRDL